MAGKRSEPMTAVEAVEQELALLGKAASPALAASARILARRMDDPHSSATSVSNCGRVLLDTINRLREQAPPKPERTAVDELDTRRQRRRSKN